MKGEFKNLPSGWKVVRLGDVFDIQSGSTPSRQNFYYWENTSIYWVKTTDLNNNFISDTEEKISEIGLKESSCKVYPKNTILIAMYGGFNQIGRTGILQIEAATNQAISALLPSTKANSLFVNNILICYRNKWKNIAISSRKDPNITKRDIENFKIPLPPLDEQEKIAEILSTWDEAINLTINLIENKKQFKKALMQNLLTAKTNWHTTILDNVGEIITGSTPSTTNEKFWNGEIAWITPTDIGDKKDIFIGERSITQDGLNATRELPANSLLVTCIASIGKNAILKVKGSCNQQINALVPNKNFNVDFLYYLLEFEKERLKNLAGITATLIISKALFSKFKISFPNIIEQQKIAEVLTACDDEINLLNLKLENLKKQKQGLMQKLLSGKVKVK